MLVDDRKGVLGNDEVASPCAPTSQTVVLCRCPYHSVRSIVPWSKHLRSSLDADCPYQPCAVKDVLAVSRVQERVWDKDARNDNASRRLLASSSSDLIRHRA